MLLAVLFESMGKDKLVEPVEIRLEQADRAEFLH